MANQESEHGRAEPKDIVTEGLPNLPTLRDEMVYTLMEIMGGTWTGGDPRDAALAYVPVIFMLEQAVDSMAQAKEIGTLEEKAEEEDEERKRKQSLILLILGVVFMFVPIVGEGIAAGMGLANLGRIIAIAGELGNVALATYDTVQNPDAGIVNMRGLLFDAGSFTKATRDAKGLADVASWRKRMKASEITSLGRFFEDGDGALQTVLGRVCKH